MHRLKARRLRALQVEPPVVLDRAAARRGLAVPPGQVARLAVLQVVLAEPRVLVLVLQVPARLRVQQQVPLPALFQQWAPQSLAQVS